jgi:hypothetical protein
MRTTLNFRRNSFPADVTSGNPEDGFDLKWSKSGVLAKYFGDQA